MSTKKLSTDQELSIQIIDVIVKYYRTTDGKTALIDARDITKALARAYAFLSSGAASESFKNGLEHFRQQARKARNGLRKEGIKIPTIVPPDMSNTMQ